MNDDHPNIVDTFYEPFIRPLGNLVVVFAQTEATLLELAAELASGDEKKGSETLKKPSAQEDLQCLIRSSALKNYTLEETLEAVQEFWRLKDERNRLIHDEWFVWLNEELNAVSVGTRGLPRKKGSDVVWGDPEVSQIWALARAIKGCGSAFSHAAYRLRSSREPDEVTPQ